LADFKTRVLQKTHVKSLIFIDFITQQAKNAKVMEKISKAGQPRILGHVYTDSEKEKNFDKDEKKNQRTEERIQYKNNQLLQ